MMLNDVQRIIDTLTVPAAEYVPAISDALTLLDELAEKLRHPQPQAVTEDGERYRWLRSFTVSFRDKNNAKRFRLPSIALVDDIMRGSVAQDLDAAIDAARRAQTSSGKGDDRG